MKFSEFTVERRLLDSSSSREEVGSFRLLFVEELKMGIRQHGDIGEFGMKGLHCTVIVISASPNQICKKR